MAPFFSRTRAIMTLVPTRNWRPMRGLSCSMGMSSQLVWESWSVEMTWLICWLLGNSLHSIRSPTQANSGLQWGTRRWCLNAACNPPPPRISSLILCFQRLAGMIRTKFLVFIVGVLKAESGTKKGGFGPPFLITALFSVYQIGPFHYAKFRATFCQWNEGVAKYFRLGLLTGSGVNPLGETVLILTDCRLLDFGPPSASACAWMLAVRERICLLLRQTLEMAFYGFRVRMIGPKSFQESGIGFAQKIARLFQLPQIL